MSVIEMNYLIEAYEILLNEDCILPRYDPLIPYKSLLIKRLGELGCKTKKDCSNLTDDELMQAGLPNMTTVSLFRAFLSLYDIPKQKLKEIEKVSTTDEEKISLYELYKLPGVRFTRAMLYYQAGYTSLQSIACALPEEIIAAAANAVASKQLQCKPPLLKEAKTHIAVARALTIFSAQ